MNEIQQLLQQYPPDCSASRIDPLGSAGGMSGAQFWRAITPRGTLALRRWPAEHPTAEGLSFIHDVLRHAAGKNITFLPVPIQTRTGQSFVMHSGHLWELARWMPGHTDYERSPSVEKLQAAMRALAQFHVAAADFAGPRAAAVPPAIQKRLARLRELERGGIHELSQAVHETVWPELAPLAREFIAALPHAISRAIILLEPFAEIPLPIQPCIRDVWHDHVLFTGNEVTGLIDFGAVDFDTPTTDIARLLGSLVGDDAVGWQTGLDAYSSVRPLSQKASLAVLALDSSGTILAGCNWIRWIYIEGRTFENREQVIERFRRILRRCRRFAARPSAT